MYEVLNKELLEHGAYYSGICRNAEVARWDGVRQMFLHWRTKFGSKYLEYIKHPDDEQYYDTFKVHKKLVTIEEEIPLED